MFKQLPLEINTYIQSYNRVKIPEIVAECIQRNVDNTSYGMVMRSNIIIYRRTTKIHNYSFSVSMSIDKGIYKHEIYILMHKLYNGILLGEPICIEYYGSFYTMLAPMHRHAARTNDKVELHLF